MIAVHPLQIIPEFREHIRLELADLASNKNETKWEIPSMYTPLEVDYITVIAKRLGMIVDESRGTPVVRKPHGYKVPPENKIQEIVGATGA